MNLRFPNAPVNTNITNDLTVELIPKGANEYELANLSKTSDTITFRLNNTVPTSTISKVISSHQFPDQLAAKQQEFTNTLILRNNHNEWRLTGINIMDYDLDARMVFTRFRFVNHQDFEGTMNLAAIDANGNETLLAQGVELKTVPTATSQLVYYDIPSGTTKLRIYSSEGSSLGPNTNLYFYAYTKIADPNSVHFTEVAQPTLSSPNNPNRFYNYASFEYRYVPLLSNTYSGRASYSTLITPYTPMVRALKSGTNSTILMNDRLSYTLYLLNGNSSNLNYFQSPDVIENPVFIDLLPEGLEYVAGSGTLGNLSSNPLNNFDGKISKKVEPEIVYNYNNTGRTALIVRVNQEVHPNVSQTSPYLIYYTFQVKATNVLTEGVNTNSFYITYDNNDDPSAVGQTIVTAPTSGNYFKHQDIYDLDNDGNTTENFPQSNLNFTYVPPREVIATKYVKGNIDPEYVQTGGREELGTNGTFQLRIFNNSIVDVKQLTAIDVLPYVGDVAIAPDQQGVYEKRNSQYELKLTGPITGPEGYTIYYITELPNNNPKAYMDLSSWTTTPTDYSQVKGIKIVLNEGSVLPTKTTHTFTVPFSLPIDFNLTNGLKATNSFAITLNNGNDFLEATASTVELVAYEVKGNVFSDNNKDGLLSQEELKLEGIVVKLLDELGNIVLGLDGKPITAVTDAQGNYHMRVHRNGNYRVSFVLDELLYTVTKQHPLNTNNANHVEDNTFISPIFALNALHRSQVVNAGVYREIGDLILNKIVVNKNNEIVNTISDFEFTIKINGELYNGLATIGTTNVTIVDGKVVLKANQTLKIVDLLKNAMVEIVETPLDDYVVTPTNGIYQGRINQDKVVVDFRNVYSPKTIEIIANKVWDGGPSPRPNIYFKLLRSTTPFTATQTTGEIVEPIILLDPLTTKVNWYTVEKDTLGNLYYFKVIEVDQNGNPFIPYNYEASYDEKTYTITNTFIPVEVKVNKLWFNTDYITKPEVTIRLLRNGKEIKSVILDGIVDEIETKAYNATFKDLEKYDVEGNAYIYSVTEDNVVGSFTQEVNKIDDYNFEAKNTFDATEIAYTKTFAYDPSILVYEEKMPVVPIKFALYQNGIEYDVVTLDGVKDIPSEYESGEAIDEIISGSHDDYSLHITRKYQWKNLPKYDEEGNLYEYVAYEIEMPLGFTRTENHETKVINNIWRGDVFTGRKVWEGNGPRSQVSLTLIRVKDPEKMGEAPYTGILDPRLQDPKYQTDWLDTVIVDGVVDQPNSEGSGETLPWNYTWVNLLRFDETKSEAYLYYIIENTPPIDYKYDNNLSNVYSAVNVYQKTSFTTTKEWLDVPEGVIIDPVQLVLVKDGVDVVGSEQVVSSTSPNATWTNLDRFNEDGSLIEYRAKEKVVQDGFVVSYNTDTTKISNRYMSHDAIVVNKLWNGGPAIKPTVTILLYQKRGEIETLYDKYELLDGQIDLVIEGLPKSYFDSKTNTYLDFSYRIDEVDNLPNYQKLVEGNTITNTFIPFSKTYTKEWTGQALVEEQRPTVYFQLYRQTSEEAVKEAVNVPQLVDETLSVTWNNLEQYAGMDDNNTKIPYIYTLEEVDVLGNIFADPNYSVKVDDRLNKVTNTLNTISFTATKLWENGPTTHPEVQIQLYRNEQPYGDPVWLRDPQTEHTFTNLLEFDPDGVSYRYHVDELTSLIEYRKELVDSQTIKNHYQIQPMNLIMSKSWVGGKNIQATATFTLLADDLPAHHLGTMEDGKYIPGQRVNPITLSNTENEIVFLNLPKTKVDGTEIVYTVIERNDDQFNSVKTTYGFKNTYIIQPTNIRYEKIWVGGSALEVEAKIHLLADGQPAYHTGSFNQEGTYVPGALVESISIKNGDSLVLFSDVPVTTPEGEVIVYTVVEDSITNYSSKIEKSTITNTYTSPTQDVKATKQWINGKVSDHVEVTLQLQRTVDAETFEVVDKVPVVTKEDSLYNYLWTEVEMTDKEGKPYMYSVVELDEFENYKTTIDSLQVVNTYQPKFTDLTVRKEWVGNELDYVVIHLLANGQPYDEVTLSPSNQWQYTFTNLPVEDANYEAIRYQIEEETVEGYSVKITGTMEEGFVVINTEITVDAETPVETPVETPIEKPDLPKTGYQSLFHQWIVVLTLLGAGAYLLLRKVKND